MNLTLKVAVGGQKSPLEFDMVNNTVQICAGIFISKNDNNDEID